MLNQVRYSNDFASNCMWADLSIALHFASLGLSGFFGLRDHAVRLSAADWPNFEAVTLRLLNAELTKDEPRLLVSILMGNTIINCLFFVITGHLAASRAPRMVRRCRHGNAAVLVVVGEIIPVLRDVVGLAGHPLGLC